MRLIVLLFAGLLVSGCASTRGYQKAGADGIWRTGYSDTKVNETTYRVSYLDDGNDKVYQGFMRRAAEIASSNQAPFFCVKDSRAGNEGKSFSFWSGGVGSSSSLQTYDGIVVLEKTAKPDCYKTDEVLGNMIAAIPDAPKPKPAATQPASSVPSNTFN